MRHFLFKIEIRHLLHNIANIAQKFTFNRTFFSHKKKLTIKFLFK